MKNFSSFDKLKKFKATTDEQTIDQMDLISEFANERYEHFRKIWTEYDEISFWIGMLLTVWLLLFHQFVMFGRSEQLQDMAGVTGLAVNWFTYIGAAGFEFYPLWVSGLVAFVITFGFSLKTVVMPLLVFPASVCFSFPYCLSKN